MKIEFRQHLVAMLFSIGIVLNLTHANAANAESFSDTKSVSNCELTLGVSDWFPYQSLSDKGKPSGIQIQLIQQIFRKANCKLKYKSMTFPQGLSELKKGNVDLLMNATPSVDRKKYGFFSIPYRNEFLLLYSTKKYLKRCQTMSLSQLLKDGFKLGLQKKLVYGLELAQIQQDSNLNRNIHYINNNVQHLEVVINHKLDGIVDDPVVVSYRSAVNVTGNALSSCPIVVSSSPVSLMYSKKTVPLEVVKKIDLAILKIKKLKSYQKTWVW